MTIPVSFFGSIVCLLLSIMIHLLLKLVGSVSELRTDAAVERANYHALDQRVKNVEHEVKSLRSQTA